MLDFTLMEMPLAASEKRQPFRDARGQGSIVFDPARLRQATPAMFDAASYGADAQPIQGQGGRGAAWFVRGEFGDAVLRRYRRGGWMARLSDSDYLWQGEDKVRSFREFTLMQRLCRAGLPVPAPIAAYYRRSGLRYRAAILIERISDVRSFADAVGSQRDEAPWAKVGAAIARCHRHAAHHADLNAHNLLIGGNDDVWLIDWDKGRMETAAGKWCDLVLARLERSLRKIHRDQPATLITQGMATLREAHQQALQA